MTAANLKVGPVSGVRGHTIFAPASGAGRAAVSVIRLSGPSSGEAVAALLNSPLPPVRRASLRALRDPRTNELLDHALVIWMPGPASFTGEDQAELHLHGSAAVRAAVLACLSALPACRPAEPGEFTRRAFLNGRLDLTAVEGLADLIDAETEVQRRQAIRQMDGALSRETNRWRDRLLDVLAMAEAALDFADEDDVPADVASSTARAAAEVRDEIAIVLARGEQGERVRDGFTVVIAGLPNAGKSTLLNAIARRDVAIVSSTPGTTRDAIEVRCDLGGLPVRLVDTAGLRISHDLVEQEGVARARRVAQQADLVLWLSAIDEPSRPDDGFDPGRLLLVRTKADLDATSDAPSRGEFRVSAATEAGLPDLLTKIRERADVAMGAGGDAVMTRARHRAVMSDVLSCLDRAAKASQEALPELLAEDIRLALRALGRMTGAVGAEDVLDRIFASFCIGK